MVQYDDLSFSDCQELFRKWREDNVRSSEDVVRLWQNTLERKQHKLGKERHLVMEQVLIAALDTNQLNLANQLIEELRKEFPTSKRVTKYKLMLLEAAERYDEARELLDQLSASDISNAAPRKRLIALLKAENKIDLAIAKLCEYLKDFMSDQEAWHELSNLYMSVNDYQKAAFCMEEVLLHNPHSHLIHQRLGEIRYTLGGLDNIEIAKSYYSQAIKLNPKNLRALYGLYLCCHHIGNSKMVVSKRKEAQKLSQWALAKVAEITQGEAKGKQKKKGAEEEVDFVAAVEASFGTLEIK